MPKLITIDLREARISLPLHFSQLQDLKLLKITEGYDVDLMGLVVKKEDFVKIFPPDIVIKIFPWRGEEAKETITF